jgi:uncharacterized protein (TIGR02996 family)
MATTLHDAFLEDIVAHPTDDHARLIYADWLEDHGDSARAELIHTQIALTDLDPDSERYTELDLRVEELLDEHEEEWAGPIRSLVKEYRFRRGFVAEVSVSGEQFLQHAATLVKLTPLESIAVNAESALVEAIALRPELRRVRRLEVRGHDLGDASLGQLASSPYLGPLEHLTLHACGLSTAAAHILAGMPLDHLTHLNLGANDLRDNGAVVLCACPKLTRLRYLGVGGNELGPPTAEALVASPSLWALERMNLGANYFDDDAVALLANAANLASLRELDLRYNEFGFEGARALAASPYLARLTRLDVTENAIGLRGVELLRERFANSVTL